MVETRFDRRVYEEDEEESNGGGGSSESSSSSETDSSSGGGSNSTNTNIIDRGTIAPNMPGNDSQPVNDKERIAPNAPEETESSGGGSSGGSDVTIIDGDSGSSSSGGSSNPPSKETIAPNTKPGGPADPTPTQDLSIKEIDQAIESQPRVSPQAQRNRDVLEANKQIQQSFNDLERTEKRIRGSDRNTKYRIGEETISRSEALNRIDERQEEAQTLQRQNIENFEKREKEINKRFQGAVQKARQRTGIQRPTSIEGIKDTIENPADQALITGVELINIGEKFGENLSEKSPNPIQETIEFRGRLAEETPLDRNPLLQASSDFVGKVEDAGQKGVGSGTTALPGLALSTAGAVPKALEDQELTQGVVKGFSLTKEEIVEDPTGFAAEEFGEEVTESAATAAVLGPLGGAATTITPDMNVVADFTPDSNVGMLDAAVMQSVPGNDVMIVDTAEPETPEFVSDPRPETPAEKADATGRDLQVNDISVDIDRASLSSETRSTPETTVESPFIDQSPSQSRGPLSDSLSEFTGQPDTITEAKSRAEPVSRPESITDVLAEFQPETQPKIEPTIRAESTRSTVPTPGRRKENSLESIFGSSTEQPEQGPERAPSLDAVLQGITSDETGGDEEFFTGFETRPISTKDTEKEINDLF